MTDDEQIQAFFDPYDDIAVEVCSSPYPNEILPDLTNLDICEEVCDALDVDTFDLFADIPTATIETSTDPETVRAYAFMYLLRWQIFAVAKEFGVGGDDFNDLALAHSEVWYLRLANRYSVLTGGEENKTWLN